MAKKKKRIINKGHKGIISNHMKLIPIMLYMVLLFSNIIFIFVDLIDYYKEKLESD